MIFRRHPRWLPKRFAPRLLPSYPQNSSHPLPLTLSCRLLTRLSPLECAVTSKHRVLPGFGRNCPSATPLECALTKRAVVTPLECAVTKKVGGIPIPRDFPISIFEFPCSRSSARLQTCGAASTLLAGDTTLDARSFTGSSGLRLHPVCGLPLFHHLPRSGARAGGQAGRRRNGLPGRAGNPQPRAAHPARALGHGGYSRPDAPLYQVDHRVG